MDFFVLNTPTFFTSDFSGQIINDIKSKLWIERFLTNGEFKLVADVNSGIKDKMPIGSYISHSDATEIMIVEDHSISEDADKEPEIVITGRSWETIFENRIVGANKSFLDVLTVTQPSDFALEATWLDEQIVFLINAHIHPDLQWHDENAIPDVKVESIAETLTAIEARSIKIGTLYNRVRELLQIDKMGIRNIRPGFWSSTFTMANQLLVQIYSGEDKTGTVTFSYQTGELIKADYLWSNRYLKDTAYIYGKWMNAFVHSLVEGADRRTLVLEASDLDEKFAAVPAGAAYANIYAQMLQRGRDAIASQRTITLASAEVNPENHAKYRIDYNLGDLIGVIGNYNESSSMRVTEYVEIEDENGSSGQPTLTLP